MSAERIKVIAHSGYRGEETPMALILNDEKIEVTEILDRWVEEDLEDRSRKRFFLLKGRDGKRHKLYYAEELMEWYYVGKERRE